MDALKPRFEWGQRVQSAVDLFNDGSYPERAADELRPLNLLAVWNRS